MEARFTRGRGADVGRATIMILVAAAAVAGGRAEEPVGKPDEVVDKILSRLEQRDVHDLRASVRWVLTYENPIEADENDPGDVKLGKLWYKELDPVPKFLVHFTDRIVANRKRTLDERHMFDGRWYIEVNPRAKSVTRREIRTADDTRNPYKLGEGVFPLPFGQSRADIEREFTITRVENRADDPGNTDRLHLVPRPGTRTAQSYGYVDLWIAREGPVAGLPVKVEAGKLDGTGKLNSKLTITFSDIELDTGFSGSIFKIDTPAGYNEYIEPIATPTLDAPATQSADKQ